MKYIFLDANIFLLSVLSSSPEHYMSSFSLLGKLDKYDAKLIVPEIVKIEFERNQQNIYERLMRKIDELDRHLDKVAFEGYPMLEGEKKQLKSKLQTLKNGRKDKYLKLTTEIGNLFSSSNVKLISIDADIFIKAYLRCHKKIKPFNSKNEEKLQDKKEVIPEGSWMNDALIIESLIDYCKTLDKTKDGLIFCSDNIDDFAEYDDSKKEHVLHKDIKKDFPLAVTYYRKLPEMMEKELAVKINASESAKMTNWSDYISSFWTTHSITLPAGTPLVAGSTPIVAGSIPLVAGSTPLVAGSTVINPLTKLLWPVAVPMDEYKKEIDIAIKEKQNELEYLLRLKADSDLKKKESKTDESQEE